MIRNFRLRKIYENQKKEKQREEIIKKHIVSVLISVISAIMVTIVIYICWGQYNVNEKVELNKQYYNDNKMKQLDKLSDKDKKIIDNLNMEGKMIINEIISSEIWHNISYYKKKIKNFSPQEQGAILQVNAIKEKVLSDSYKIDILYFFNVCFKMIGEFMSIFVSIIVIDCTFLKSEISTKTIIYFLVGLPIYIGIIYNNFNNTMLYNLNCMNMFILFCIYLVCFIITLLMINLKIIIKKICSKFKKY